MARIIKTESDCRLLYAEIVNGYSYVPEGKYFLKHYNEIEAAITEQKRREYLKEADDQGLLSQEEKLKLLAINGHWTTEEEKAYKEALEELDGLRQSVRKLIISWQIEDISKKIIEKEKEIRTKFRGRAELIGSTKEAHSAHRASESHVLRAFYKDAGLTQYYFEDKNVDDLLPSEVNIFMDIYYNSHEVFIEKNFKRIAVCPFFLNAYLVSNDNPYFFFGKPIALLTIYQLALFSRGQYYKNIIEETPARPPDDYYDDLDKVIKFYDLQYSLIQSKRKSQSSSR